jgi:hypothetical protein
MLFRWRDGDARWLGSRDTAYLRCFRRGRSYWPLQLLRFLFSIACLLRLWSALFRCLGCAILLVGCVLFLGA